MLIILITLVDHVISLFHDYFCRLSLNTVSGVSCRPITHFSQAWRNVIGYDQHRHAPLLDSVCLTGVDDDEKDKGTSQHGRVVRYASITHSRPRCDVYVTYTCAVSVSVTWLWLCVENVGVLQPRNNNSPCSEFRQRALGQYQHHGAQCFNACNSLPDAVVSSRSAAVFKRNLQSVDFPAV